MKRMESRWNWCWLGALAAVLIFVGIDSSQAAVFCVSSSSELQSALNTSETNGEADEIRIVQGRYYGNFTYQPQESYEIVIKGGYVSGCASRVSDPANTILSGGSAGSVLAVDSEGSGHATCSGMTFQNGSAERGGGLFISAYEGNIEISGNVFYQNNAVQFGGGMYISSNGTMTVSGNTMAENQSEYYAGAAAIDGGALVMEGNVIRGNSASGAVGGAWTTCRSISMTNNLFYDNSATWYHGAILSEGDVVKIINNTIAYNYAEGPGAGLTLHLKEDSDSAAIYNNILYGNSGYHEGNDLDIRNDQNENGTASPVSLLNNDFDQSAHGAIISLPFPIDPSNLNNVYPLFISPENQDYRLGAGSPCIDTGASTDAPATDIRGISRPQGLGYDMGAYEYVGPPDLDMKANGQDGPLVVTPETPVSITLSLDSGDKLGRKADWWVLCHASAGTSSSWFSLALPTGWQSGIQYCVQIPLFDILEFEVLRTALPLGNYTFYFGIDDPDAAPSGPWWGIGSVEVRVQ